MYFPFIIPGIIFVVVLLFFGWFNKPDGQPRIQLLMGGAFLLLVLGLFIGMNGLEMQVGEPYMNYSSENSFYWNGTCNETTLELEQDTHFVYTTNLTNGTVTGGQLGNTYTDDGIFYEVSENGVNMTVDWEFRGLHNIPLTLEWYGYFWQGNVNEGFDLYLYNVSNGVWVKWNVSNPYVDRSIAEEVWIFDFPNDMSNYISGSSPNEILWVRFQVNNNHNTSSHTLHTNYMFIQEPVGNHTYVPVYAIVGCTRDRIEVNYTYANYTYMYGTMDFAYSEITAAILILTGLALMLGIWDWFKIKNSVQDI